MPSDRDKRPEPEPEPDEVEAAEALILLSKCDGGFCSSFIINLPTKQPSAVTVSVEEQEPVSPDTPLVAAANSNRRHKCFSCGDSFQSHQALGGHMTRHRPKPQTAAPSSAARIHECSTCHQEFSSGQALGGHKRKHYIGQSIARKRKPANSTSSSSSHTGRDDASRPSIDLNMPPPEESE